jgi:hypothetical protein
MDYVHVFTDSTLYYPVKQITANIQVQKTFRGSTGFRPSGPIRFKCFASQSTAAQSETHLTRVYPSTFTPKSEMASRSLCCRPSFARSITVLRLSSSVQSAGTRSPSISLLLLASVYISTTSGEHTL